jgi:hypothetical protein
LATFDMKYYARRGAEARLADLSEEIEAIHGAFPELRQTRRGRPRQAAQGIPRSAAGSPATIEPDGRAHKRKRKGMSAAQRKAVGERMRKYWAARRTEGTKKR